MSTRVIGVGSPFGDDRAGWEVVAALEATLRSVAAPPQRIDIRACDRPGAALVHMLAGVQHAVIIDVALSPGSPAGSVRWLDEREIEARRAASSHGFGLAEALALARALGDAPSRVSVLAISATHWEGDALSDPVREAVPVAVREVLALIRGDDADAATRPPRLDQKLCRVPNRMLTIASSTFIPHAHGQVSRRPRGGRPDEDERAVQGRADDSSMHVPCQGVVP